MLVYPSGIDLSRRTLRHLSGLLAGHRRRIGSRWRRLTCGRQALLVLAHLRCGDTYAGRASGFRIGIATAYRYIREAVDLLAALAPMLQQAMTTVRKKAYVILDGTELPIDRIAADQPYYSGKKKHHGVNVQVLADPAGRLIWASDALPGATRPDRGPEPRHTRRPRRRRHQVLGRQGVPGRRPCDPCPDPWQAPPRLAPTPQPRSRQDSQPRRTRHGHTQVLAAPAEAPLQHHPDHSCSSVPSSPSNSPPE